MKRLLPLLFLPILQVGCAAFFAASTVRAETPCGPGTRSDPSRQARIVALLRPHPESASLLATERVSICFGAGLPRGVLSGDVALLDEHSRDPELAARLSHLLVHHRDKLGDGCAAGLEAARASESQAARLEQQLLLRFGLAPSPLRDESAQDYAQRCRANASRVGDGRTI
jgi:hypothetical protein